MDDMVKALEALSDYEGFSKRVIDLAVLYDREIMTADQFAKRVCEIIRDTFSKYVP